MRLPTARTQARRDPIAKKLFACAVFGFSLSFASLATPSESQALIPAQTIGRSPANAAETTDTSVGSSAVYRSPDSRQTLLPKASGSYLRESPEAVGKPQLVIAYYNLTEGLLAGYQSVSGKRILLRGRWLSNGAVNPEVAHLNSATGQIELLMGRSKQLDASTGQRAKVYEVAGVDFMARLDDARRGNRSSSTEPDEIRQFMDSEAGQAFAEAMPVLYSALESLESDPKLAALQAPFGGILTALQLSTGVYTGLDNLDLAIGVTRANSLREGCGNGECRYRGRNFTVQNNGLFDVLGKSGAASGKKLSERGLSSTPRSLLQTLIEFRKNGNGICDQRGNCFGFCGLGCFTPGDIKTPEC